MRFKRFTAGIVAAVMAVTAVATPLGDNLLAVRESTSLTAGAMSTSEVKNKIEAMARGDYGAEFKAGNYWNTKITSPCTRGTNYQHANQNYDKKYPLYLVDSNGKSIHSDSGAIQCKGFGYAVFDQLFGGGDKNAIVATKTTYTGTNKKQYIIENAVVGDLLVLIESGSTYGHTGIYYGYDDNYLKMYDANGYSNGGTCKISITENRPWTDKKFYNNSTVIIMHAKCNGSTGGNIDNPVTNVTDHYKLTSPDGYQTIRKEASTSSANLGSINTGNIVCVTKYSSDNKWGYLTYNGVSGWIRLYYVEKTGSTHSYGSWYTKTSATCTSGGTEERKCSCGATESRSTSALGHSYGSWYTSVNPGCTTAGTEKRVCSRCSNAEYRSTSATGHSYGYWETDKAATCTDGGTEVRICSRCSNAEYRTVSALGHNYSSQWTIDKPATCSAEGSKSRHCTRCDAKTEVTAIAKIAHTYTSKVVKPTLTEQGYTLHTCSVCGYSYKDNYTAVRENPSKVTGLAFGARSADYVSLKWNKDANADGYIVEYLSGNKFVKLVDKTSGSSVSHKVTGLEAGKLYKFRIRSYVNVDGKRVYGEYSDVMNVRTLPKAMSNLKLGARTDNSISLKWDKNETANGAVVEMYKNGQWVVVATKTSNTAVSHKITGLDASTAYKFRVRAYINDEGGRIYSVYNTTLNEATAPASVKNFRRTISAKTAIRFNWDKNTTADGYSFEMIKNSKWTTVATIEDGTATNYSQLKLNPGTAYRFRIRAYKVVNGKKIFSGYSYVNASTAK